MITTLNSTVALWLLQQFIAFNQSMYISYSVNEPISELFSCQSVIYSVSHPSLPIIHSVNQWVIQSINHSASPWIIESACQHDLKLIIEPVSSRSFSQSIKHLISHSISWSVCWFLDVRHNLSTELERRQEQELNLQTHNQRLQENVKALEKVDPTILIQTVQEY